jgi:hypothetical protein
MEIIDSDKPDFTAEAELILKSRSYPSHMQVKKGAQNFDTGQWIMVFDWDGTRAYIETVLRHAHSKGENRFDAVFNHKGSGVSQSKDDLISLEQSTEIGAHFDDDLRDMYDQFLEYMGVESRQEIKAKDYKKALSAIETIKKAQP